MKLNKKKFFSILEEVDNVDLLPNRSWNYIINGNTCIYWNHILWN